MLLLMFYVKRGWFINIRNLLNISIRQKFEHIKENFFKPFIGRTSSFFDDLMQFFDLFSSLRKVKLDQRKLTDNVNAVSDIARVRSYFSSEIKFFISLFSCNHLSMTLLHKCYPIKMFLKQNFKILILVSWHYK